MPDKSEIETPRGFVEWDRDLDDEYEDDEDFFDCHMGPDGQCGAAGSEWCDFECPTMRQFRRGSLP